MSCMSVSEMGQVATTFVEGVKKRVTSYLPFSATEIKDREGTNGLEFVSYWCGYRDNGQETPLYKLPAAIDIVPLAFAGLNPDSTMTTSFLSKDYGEATVKKWAKECQEQGHRVTMSLIDSQTVSWNDIDVDIFVKSAKEKVMDEWGLDGFDIDGEGGAIDRLREVVPKLRAQIGPDPIITYTCYTGSDEDTKILKAINKDISWVQTMAYGLGFDRQVGLARHYAAIVGTDRVTIGVKVGVTPTDEVTKLAAWVKENGYRGMMLWSADMDNTTFTKKKIWTWESAVEKGLLKLRKFKVLQEDPLNSSKDY